MSTVDKFIELKNKTTFQRIVGPSERRSTLAFIDDEGDILFLDDRPCIKKEEVVLFAEWILEIYEENTVMPREMTKIRDKHFAIEQDGKGDQ